MKANSILTKVRLFCECQPSTQWHLILKRNSSRVRTLGV